MNVPNNAIILGAREVCDLPELGVMGITTRVDTGAQTSSLHAINIHAMTVNGKLRVSFVLPKIDYDGLEYDMECDLPVLDVRRVKSSNGQAEKRYVIESLFQVGSRSWRIELTLSNRSAMTHALLLGRQGMPKDVLVYPSQQYLVEPVSEPTSQTD